MAGFLRNEVSRNPNRTSEARQLFDDLKHKTELKKKVILKSI